jgi:signal transduction histidine kinase
VPEHVLERATKAGSIETQGWRVRKDGTRFFADAIVTALRDNRGVLRGFAKVTRDITERLTVEKHLEQTRAALAQAQKLQAVGQLTGGLAHDFNNILTAIIGSVELIQRGGQDVTSEKAAQLLATARTAAEQGAGLVKQLLAFSRRQTLAPRPVDINRLVGGMSELLRRTLGDAISLETVLAGGLWQTLIDPNQLESAVLNLALNARDAMPEGGKLTIETGNTYLDEDYAALHEEVSAGQYVVLSVTDTGKGMSAETLNHAFDPFFTTKPEGEGTGLGLSQVFGFVKQSGGHIKLYSEPDQGTTVKIYLPRHAAAVSAEPVERKKPSASAAGGQTILVVEDQLLVQMFATDALQSLGYSVLEASNGREALEILEHHPETALLFTDVGLPGGMNGRQLADEARRLNPALKVLFATGYARNAIVHNGVLDPGVELLDKPYTVEALGQKLHQMLSS